MSRSIKILLLVFTIVLVGKSVAYAIEAKEIVYKAQEAVYYQAQDGRSKVNMVITDSLGREREREMIILRKNSEGKEQKYYVYFEKPNDVKGMTYLVWKNPASDDDRWLYLPALDLVRRVASNDKRASFVGSNFAYEDISGRSSEEDEHELISSLDGEYRIKSIPKNPESVEFSYFETLINPAIFNASPIVPNLFLVGSKACTQWGLNPYS